MAITPRAYFIMSDQQDNQETARLAQVNAELTRSLKRCRVLLEDCRAKLAANSNEPESANEDDGNEERASRET
jgi:hypothetical protein